MSNRGDIFIVDDEEALCISVTKILSKEGYRVSSFHTSEEGMSAFDNHEPHLLITDLQLPGLNGIELLKYVRETKPNVEVIVLTGHGSVETAVDAMRLGAYDFIEKPIDRNALVKAVNKAIEKQKLSSENRQLRLKLQQQGTETEFIGNHPLITAVKKLIRQIAPTDVSVLIQGESGTGKEIVADIIHNLSHRSSKPLVKVSCAAIPETLLESELFGYERGAFTGATGSKPGKFELAHGGTLFLDEIAEMSTKLQAKLLRVLQDGRDQRLGSTRDIQTDVRIISATHFDLRKAILENTFRNDLFYRLNVVSVVLPPLRDRLDDIPLLTDHLLKKHTARMQKKGCVIKPEAMGILLTHPWPGNVRELENTIQRALALAVDNEIQNFSLTAPPKSSKGEAGNSERPSVTIPIGSSLEDAQDRIISRTIELCEGDKEKAAHLLGISSRTLYRRSAKPLDPHS